MHDAGLSPEVMCFCLLNSLVQKYFKSSFNISADFSLLSIKSGMILNIKAECVPHKNLRLYKDSRLAYSGTSRTER